MKVLLFSGGVDSTCLALLEKPDLALTIDYGQVCSDGEKRAAIHISSYLDMPHEIVSVPFRHLGRGDLTGISSGNDFSTVPEHWPFRNQMLITVAAMALARRNPTSLIIGTVATDKIHNDGTNSFLCSMDAVLRAQLSELRLSAPAINMTTTDLVLESGVSDEILRWTFSCHRAPIACGNCRGCMKSLELFSNLNI